MLAVEVLRTLVDRNRIAVVPAAARSRTAVVLAVARSRTAAVLVVDHSRTAAVAAAAAAAAEGEGEVGLAEVADPAEVAVPAGASRLLLRLLVAGVEPVAEAATATVAYVARGDWA